MKGRGVLGGEGRGRGMGADASKIAFRGMWGIYPLLELKWTPVPVTVNPPSPPSPPPRYFLISYFLYRIWIDKNCRFILEKSNWRKKDGRKVATALKPTK